MPSEPHQNIFIVTGKVQGGKSSFVRGLVQRFQTGNISVAGFCCTGSFKNGTRSAFTLVNLDDGMMHPLATIEKTEGWQKFNHFYFNQETFQEGARIIEKGLKQKRDVVVVDEVGPLELQGGGWASLLKKLHKEYIVNQLWVVREKIVQIVLHEWNIPETHVFRLTDRDAETVKNMEDLIIKAIRKEGTSSKQVK